MSALSSRRVLLIASPWQLPSASSLALGILRPILEREGIACDELHGSMLFPFTFSDSQFMESTSAYLFAPYLYPSICKESLIARMLEHVRHEQSLGGLLPLSPNQDNITAQLREQAYSDIERAGECIDRIVERASAPEYDIVGFSCTFEDQLPAALTVAKRLKALNPDVKIMLGGAACFETQGDGLAASFETLDAVCHSEGEHVIGALVRALRGEIAMEEVEGIAWRDSDGVLRHNPSPASLVDMDTIPMASFEPFIAQFQESRWSGFARPKLFFETSRGCWWGQKHLCTFCGLNAEGLAFRRKSPERAYAEIAMLHANYPTAIYLQATDNILDMGYLEHVMPRLRKLCQDNPDRPPRIFYEIKSNLRRDQVKALGSSGVVDVQPGIESFSDDVLKLMNKGSTGLSQVQFIKWAFEADINLIYNIIIRNPGEEAPWYEEMLDLLPFITHLPPPIHVTSMMLERFSPYHSNPGRYGITNVRPKSYYRDLYPDPKVDLDRIAYIFDYDHPILEDEGLTEVLRRFVSQVMRWQQAWTPWQAFFLDYGGSLVVIDKRGSSPERFVLTGESAEIYRYLSKSRPAQAIHRHFAHLDEALVETLLEIWLHKRWVCKSGPRYLAVLPEFDESAVAEKDGAVPEQMSTGAP